MNDNTFPLDDELNMEETKMINLTKNEVLFIDDACTMLIEPEINLPLPLTCTISITTDGINYTESEESFNIYSDQLRLGSIVPKSGSV